MPNFPKKLKLKLEKRATENSLREFPVQNDLVDFFSNDYLGFSRETWIRERTQEILKSSDSKNGATGSRLLSGNHVLYKSIENKLANFHTSKTAIVFNSGYDANIGFFSSVPQRGDFIFYDEYIHASIRDGIQLSNAKSYKFKHNNLEDLKLKIKLSVQSQLLRNEGCIYIVTESVFSMDGDSPNLKELAAFCDSNRYLLVVDEAHATGIFGNGKGLCVTEEIEALVFARIITFGKAIGSHGAAILGSTTLKDYLVNFARSFIYTTALPPHTIAACIAAYELLISRKGNENRRQLIENISYFKHELEIQGLRKKFVESDSAIQCMAVSGNFKAKTSSKLLEKNGYSVKPILSPTVPKGKERLRICLHTYNTKEEIKEVIHILNQV